MDPFNQIQAVRAYAFYREYCGNDGLLFKFKRVSVPFLLLFMDWPRETIHNDMQEVGGHRSELHSKTMFDWKRGIVRQPVPHACISVLPVQPTLKCFFKIEIWVLQRLLA